MTETGRRCITAEDLYRFKIVQEPQISPDGRHVIYAVQWVDRDDEKKYSNLWLASTNGGKPRQFTVGNHTDSMPRWSPDSNQIAFLSNRDDEKQSQIYLIPFDGGEARQLTTLKGSVGEFHWSPNGRKLLLQFRKKDQDAIEREEDEKKKKLGVVERHITRAFFRVDGTGYLPKERWHLWIVDVKSGEAIQLTVGEYDELQPRWSSDGSQIVFISNRSEDPDLNPDLDDVYIISAESEAPLEEDDLRLIETPVGSKSAPSFSPDGQWISYVSSEGKGNWWKNNGLWVVNLNGTAPSLDLTSRYDIDVSSSTLADVANRSFTTPVWSDDGHKLYFQVSQHGTTTLKSITLDRQMEDVLVAKGVISNFSLDQEQEKLAYIWSDFDDPGQVYVRELASSEPRQLSDVNTSWLSEVDLGEREEVWIQGADGNDIQGWTIKPPGFDPNHKYPSILEIHGGPWMQYGNLFMHEFYFLAAQGYVVSFANPRGGQGYGEAHSKAIHLNWGGPDYADVMAWTDHIAQQPYIDSERMGVTGGSYGGYMTLWIIGHTARFKAAVAQRVVSNTISFWGSSDVGYLFEDPWADNQPPWEALDVYWDQSPMKYIGNARTPTLIIHSEQDMRCHPEQGIQAFLALKRLGVDTELVLYPDESHGLSRGGRTDRRISRLNHILRWFQTYL